MAISSPEKYLLVTFKYDFMKKNWYWIGFCACYPKIDVFMKLTLQAPTLQNVQTHLNNLSAFTDKFFQFVWPFCGVGTYMVKLQDLCLQFEKWTLLAMATSTTKIRRFSSHYFLRNYFGLVCSKIMLPDLLFLRTPSRHLPAQS